MVATCSVKGCTYNVHAKVKYRIRALPAPSKPDIREMWMKRCEFEGNRTRYYVCDRHFSDHCRVPGMDRLKYGSLPSLFLPSMHDDSMEASNMRYNNNYELRSIGLDIEKIHPLEPSTEEGRDPPLKRRCPDFDDWFIETVEISDPNRKTFEIIDPASHQVEIVEKPDEETVKINNLATQYINAVELNKLTSHYIDCNTAISEKTTEQYQALDPLDDDPLDFARQLAAVTDPTYISTTKEVTADCAKDSIEVLDLTDYANELEVTDMGGMGQEELILGIDIGTTSVKVGILNAKVGRIIARQSKDTQANVPSELGCEGNKQNTPKIMSALHACVSRLSKDLLKQVSAIGICGQMHGVMLWNYKDDDAPWEKAANDSRYDIISDKVSSLYTWQDSRCDPDFLATLPKPKSHLKACTGYGCNTLFWISKNRPEKLEKFNCAGTIQDFAVAMLCELKKPIMSVQNAASWGYFDTGASKWNTEILESAGFPVDLLPKIVQSGEVAGHLTESWHSIPAGTPVIAALGDIQCSVLSALKHDDDAVLNLSTSAQMCFIAPSFDPNHYDDKSFVEYIPYFDDRYLAIAAALNGGNVLATFISTLQKWTLELGSQIPQSTIWEKVIESASKVESTSIVVAPKILGERYSPKEFGSVSNIHTGNLSLGQVFKATCAGVINNLHEIMPREMLLDNNISRIVGIGSALSRNQVLQEEVKLRYQLPIIFEGKSDAAYGAAMVASKVAKK